MDSKKLAKVLNKNLSDIQVMYVKLHNYHWNIQGKHFFGIHNLTEKYYNHFAELYDEFAERILQIGEKPLTTLKSYLENTKIKEEEKDEFSVNDVLKAVVNDFRYFKDELKKTAKVAEDEDDSTTQGLAEDNIAWLEKEIWLLNSSK